MSAPPGEWRIKGGADLIKNIYDRSLNRMDENVEKLIVALMVMIDQKGGEFRIDSEVFTSMYEVRHKKGIQVKELGDDGMTLILGDMPTSPEEAEMN